jgi:REP element-mobilizing transposase RayT
MTRHWLITWTTYGSWLPGDSRGFVGRTRGPDGHKVIHNTPGTEYDDTLPPLRNYAGSILKCAPIFLQKPHAEALAEQFHETANHRGWCLVAVAIMPDHIHLIVGMDDDPEPEEILKAFKAYASRKLNRQWGKPASETWWTESGSRRKVRNLITAVEYVRNQKNALLVWVAPEFDVSEGRRAGDVSPPV